MSNPIDEKDYGKEPYVVNIEDITKENNKFRVAKWTGDNLQLTVMSVEPGCDIGLEAHEGIDQFLRIEDGQARVEMGPTEGEVTFTENVEDDYAILVPAGTWHNIINTGDKPLKVYSIYAKPEHAHGTIHATPEDDPHHD